MYRLFANNSLDWVISRSTESGSWYLNTNIDTGEPVAIERFPGQDLEMMFRSMLINPMYEILEFQDLESLEKHLQSYGFRPAVA